MSWLQCLLGKRNTLLQQWKKYEVIKTNSSRGVKHGPSGRQKMYYQARQMLKKARQAKHGRHPTILSRWYTEEDYRKSLSTTGWKEHHIMLHDRIAVEKHIYTTIQELSAFKIRNTWFSQKMQMEELSNHSINDPTLHKRKENASDCMTSTWQEPDKNTETFLAINK